MPAAARTPDPVPDDHTARRLLVIDDDVELCSLVAEFFRREGFETEFAHDGPSGLKRALESEPAAIILDIMLPGLSGLEVLRELRRHRRTPVLMLTARGDHVDRVVGLEMGADDYIPKPFDPRELAARIRAVLRRAEVVPAPAPERADRLRCGELSADLGARAAWRGNTEIPVTLVEFNLLVELMKAGGRVRTRNELSIAARGRPADDAERSSMDMHIGNLRRKLGRNSSGESFIRTVRSAGYRLPCPGANDGS